MATACTLSSESKSSALLSLVGPAVIIGASFTFLMVMVTVTVCTEALCCTGIGVIPHGSVAVTVTTHAVPSQLRWVLLEIQRPGVLL